MKTNLEHGNNVRNNPYRNGLQCGKRQLGYTNTISVKKNPVHQISEPVWIIAPILFFPLAAPKGLIASTLFLFSASAAPPRMGFLEKDEEKKKKNFSGGGGGGGERVLPPNPPSNVTI